MNGLRVLVTGASGFTGAEVTRALLGRGAQVIACVGSGVGRLAGAEALPGLRVIQGDLAGDLALPSQVDAVVHAAARSPAPGVSVDDMVRDNVFATRKLVEHAKSCGVRAFVYLSSLSVCGSI